MQAQAYSLPNGKVVLLSDVGALPASRTTDMHLAYEGEWLGHIRPVVLTEALFDSWIDGFNKAGRPLPVDYEHQTTRVAENGKPNPLAGRITKLFKTKDQRGAHLWGTTTFTPRAAEYLVSDEYTSCSIVFNPVKDRVSGEDLGLQLTSVALTNTPFLDGLEKPVLMTFQPNEAPMAEIEIETKEDEKELAAPDATSEEKPAEEPAAEAPAVNEEKMSALSESIAAMRKLTGMDDDQLAGALASNMDKIAGVLGTQASLSAPKDESAVALSAIQAELAALKTELSVVRGLVPAPTSLHSVEPNAKHVVSLSAFNDRQKFHFNTLKTHYGYDDAKAFDTVNRNPRMAR